jgi:hypothetical protein
MDDLAEQLGASRLNGIGNCIEMGDSVALVTVDALGASERAAMHANTLEDDQADPAFGPGSMIRDMTLRRFVVGAEIGRVRGHENAVSHLGFANRQRLQDMAISIRGISGSTHVGHGGGPYEIDGFDKVWVS